MRSGLILVPAAALVAGAVALALANHDGAGSAVQATLSPASVLGTADTAGFAHAEVPRPFHFPRDHRAHPAYRNEWWYFTGNLQGPGGRRFGYELTFFRSALVPRLAARTSEWRARNVYMAHFAITDSVGGRFRARGRFARAAVGLAGATVAPAPWKVWVGDWSAASLSHTFWPVRLFARDSGMVLDLDLRRAKAPVAEGDGGLSRKGPEPGNASYYYSLTRMPTSGWIELAGTRYRVEGDSWMDREWSTSALSPADAGWDWFALQLDDGRELMLYRIRLRAGGISPFSAGMLVERDGRTRPLAAADARIDVLGTWTSPVDGARYPARWRLRVPSADLDVEVRPLLADQEVDLAFRYWEGAVSCTGHANGRPVAGRGYVELTGYGAPRPVPTGLAAGRSVRRERDPARRPSAPRTGP